MFLNCLALRVLAVRVGYLSDAPGVLPLSFWRLVTYMERASSLPTSNSTVVPSKEDIASWCGSVGVIYMASTVAASSPAGESSKRALRKPSCSLRICAR